MKSELDQVAHVHGIALPSELASAQPVPKKPEAPGKPERGPEAPGKPDQGPETPGKPDKPGREIIGPTPDPQAPHVHQPEVPRPPGQGAGAS